jgi:hypothetical protein
MEVTTLSSSLSGVTFAAKGYFDALVKMGELASESQGSKELGKTLRWTESPTSQMYPGGAGRCLVIVLLFGIRFYLHKFLNDNNHLSW